MGSEYPFGSSSIAVDDHPNAGRAYGHWSRDKVCVRDGKTGAIWAGLHVRQPIDLRSQQQDKNLARLQRDGRDHGRFCGAELFGREIEHAAIRLCSEHEELRRIAGRRPAAWRGPTQGDCRGIDRRWHGEAYAVDRRIPHRGNQWRHRPGWQGGALSVYEEERNDGTGAGNRDLQRSFLAKRKNPQPGRRKRITVQKRAEILVGEDRRLRSYGKCK